MSTRHLVDPETLPTLELIGGGDTIDAANLAEFRAAGLARLVLAPRDGLEPVVHHAPGRDGAPDVAVWVYAPEGGTGTGSGTSAAGGAPRPAVLHIHGGGMVAGAVEMSRLSAPALVAAHGAVVVSVDYRLAPETPFPGPQEDCYAALQWLLAHADELGVDPARVVVAGESAGGGLAAALALMVRDRGEHRLRAQVLTYPMLDHRVGGPDDPYANPTTGEFVWNRSKNQFGWSSLRGGYALDDERAGWFSPALAADLRGVAPAYIATGMLDLFLDEDLDYARRLAAAGVDIELHAYAGAIHAFNILPGTRLGTQYRRDLNGALARYFA